MPRSLNYVRLFNWIVYKGVLIFPNIIFEHFWIAISRFIYTSRMIVKIAQIAKPSDQL